MSGTATGDDLGIGTSQTRRAPSPSIHVDSPSGDAYSPTLATAGTLSTGAATPPTMPYRSPAVAPSRVRPKHRHIARAIFQSCADNTRRAIDNKADFFLRNNALAHVADSLSELWNMRSQREEAFAEVIQTLQMVFVDRTVEDFTPEQLAAIHAAFVKLGDPHTFDDDFANAICLSLMNGGIDVFRALD